MTQCVTCGIRHTRAQVCTAPGFPRIILKSIIVEDIDGIRIRYDSDGGASKRSYNYRVCTLRNSPQAFRGRSTNTTDTYGF